MLRPTRLLRGRPTVERLEDRLLLTATLYLDFGDRFPHGGLIDTVGNFRGAGTNGPSFRGDGGATDASRLTFTRFSATVSSALIDYDHDGQAGTVADAASLRGDIVGFVQRYYAPFDITVVSLTSAFQNVNGHMVRAAASLADVRTTLAINNEDPKHFDVYVFVAGITVNPGRVPPRLNGRASLLNIGKSMANDTSAVTIANNVLRRGMTPTQALMRLAYTTAHEAAHGFGMQHTWNGTDKPIVTGVAGNRGRGAFVVRGDVRSSLVIGARIQVTGDDDFDTIYTIAQGATYDAATGRSTIYVNQNVTVDDLENVKNLRFLYTTNEGLLNRSDIIVGSAANNAPNRLQFDFFTRFPLLTGSALVDSQGNRVSVQNNFDKFADDPNIGLAAGRPAYVTGTGANDRITVTFVSATSASVQVSAYRDAAYAILMQTITYTIDDTNGILIEGGFGADQILVDARLGVRVAARGQGGANDQLILVGNNVATATYTPASRTNRALDNNTYYSGVLTAGTTTIDISEFGNVTGALGSVLVQNIGAVTFQSPGGVDSLHIMSAAAGQNRLQGTVMGNVPFLPLVVTSDAAWNINAGLAATVSVDAALVATSLKDLMITGGAANDTLNVHTANLALPVAGGAFAFAGGGGINAIHDFINRQNPVWNITADNAGNLNSLLAFTSTQNLVAAAGNDAFVLSDGVKLAGGIDGGTGRNWIDYSAFATSVNVNLQTGVATNVAGGIRHIQNAVGGSADDIIVGSVAGSLLLGMAGHDTLVAGVARTVLIGGLGGDRIVGEPGQDILINGTTSFDADRVALQAIFNEWSRADQTYQQRIAALRSGIGPGKAYKLVWLSTVQNNGDAGNAFNLLSGRGGPDWFFTASRGDITDLGHGTVN